ncbi:hypothetical protein HCN44_006221 [Aphidius gifuensis]|uniref:Uncharacterized protein n=1 Tax=Aphidius gifuensis TaxID=684658 RepID=A0A834Y1L8_APHGI|nr:hypothetical protein HCN44_006221 [Aphidius gifuensis]
MFAKCLSARLIQSPCFYFAIILGYKTIKRWSSYSEYKRCIRCWVSHLFIQALAGIFADFKTNDITSPLDIVQARLQVQRLDSMCQVFEILKKI